MAPREKSPTSSQSPKKELPDRAVVPPPSDEGREVLAEFIAAILGLGFLKQSWPAAILATTLPLGAGLFIRSRANKNSD